MDELNGRTAIVTGGGSGIGRGIALGLAAEGMTVAVADIHAESAEAVVGEIEGQGGSAFGIQVDVTSVESLASAAKDVVARAGGPCNVAFERARRDVAGGASEIYTVARGDSSASRCSGARRSDRPRRGLLVG